MQTIREPARDIPVAAEVDVAVIGGGPAGFVAAVAAAREGASVMLVERYGCLGGLATGGLVLFMDGIADRDGNRVVGGIPWETMERLRERGALAQEGRLNLHADSELLKVTAEEMCVEANAGLRLHSWAVGAVTDGPKVKGVITESKSGRQAVLSRVCVDATGDGDIAAFAGAEYALHHQKIGLNLKVAGVHRDRYRGFRQQEPQRYTELLSELRALGGVPLVPNTTPDSDAGIYWINILGLADRGDLGDSGGDVWAVEGDLHAFFAGRLNAVDVEDISHAEVELKRRIMISLDFFRKHVPGFEDVRLLMFASQLGVRSSRNIRGLRELGKEDVVQGRGFEDAVGKSGISAMEAPGSFQVPYRSLVPRNLDGLLVAGRCISMDHWTQQFGRLIIPAMMMGQAAGKAAALAVKQGLEPAKLDGRRLSRELEADGVLM